AGGAIALLAGRRTARIGKELLLHAVGCQGRPGEGSAVVVAAYRDVARAGAQAARVRGDDTGAASEQLALDRRDDDRRVLLRHAERVAVDVLVDDQVADDHDT